jgi:CelD/BcsL family acetyltransferase involved in cellulose biosynthesis
MRAKAAGTAGVAAIARASSARAAGAATCELVASSTLPDLVDEWRALTEDAVESNVFYKPSLLIPALDAFAEKDVAVAVVRDASRRLIGLAPVAPLKGYSRLPVRYMATWRHMHCFFAAPIVRRGAEAAFFTALFGAADRRGAFLRLSHLAADGPLYAAAIAAAQADGRLVAPSGRYARAILFGGYQTEAHLERALSGKRRKEFRRLRARLSEIGPVGFERLADPAALSQWTEEFFAVEAAGWKGEAGTALALDPASSRFLREALARAMAIGALHFCRLRVGEKTIAMGINFIGREGLGESAYAFKIAFDESFARFSPGVMLEIEMMKDFESREGLLFIDSCAQANHPMIDRLWTDRRVIEALNFSRKDLVGKAIFRLLTGLERASERRRAAIAAAQLDDKEGGEDANL